MKFSIMDHTCVPPSTSRSVTTTKRSNNQGWSWPHKKDQTIPNVIPILLNFEEIFRKDFQSNMYKQSSVDSWIYVSFTSKSNILSRAVLRSRIDPTTESNFDIEISKVGHQYQKYALAVIIDHYTDNSLSGHKADHWILCLICWL